MVKRPGVDNLIKWLETSDFFDAPCSTEFHLCIPGGLAKHSLNVFELLELKVNTFQTQTPFDTIAICGLGHDLCKANFYAKEIRPRKINGKWADVLVYVTKDQFPMGHGEKSVSILQDFMSLTDEEKLAIRWHMCAFDAGIHFNYPNGFAYREAVKKSPLVTLLFTADYEASNIVEKDQ